MADEGSNSVESSVLADGVMRDVRPWLMLAEDLTELSLDKHLSVPQIAVMGDQSSGKSSVLEALSGVPFPRGSGLVTRCPTRLIMRKAAKGEPWRAVASTTKNSTHQVQVKTPEELTTVIESLTETLTGSTNGFSTESIVVKLVSETAPDLTVIDLPGIIRTATQGQAQKSINEVNDLINHFLKMERTIILAVIPSNQDIATVDILERAAVADPNGVRTIGVLTKPDLIGPGGEDEVLAVLHNVRKPLKLGYIMVKNRSQKELASGMSCVEAREAEMEFFTTHPIFKDVDSSKFGVSNLTTSLTRLLVRRIQQELVPMKHEVESALQAVRIELKSLESYGAANTPAERQKLLVTLTQEYMRHLNDCVRGEYRDRLIVTNPDLRLYTRALNIFTELQARIMATAPPFKDPNFVAGLARQMEQLRGRELPGFMSAQSFYMFIQEYIDKWKAPARMAISQMRVLSLEVATKLVEAIAVSYPVLRDAYRGVAARILETAETDCVEAVDKVLAREKDPFTLNDFLQAHINKLRHDRFAKAVATAFAKTKAHKESWSAAKEEVTAGLRTWYRESHGVNSSANAEDMSAILEAYWHLAAKRFTDNACMILDEHVMGALVSQMQEQCYVFVHDKEKLSKFFEEDSDLVQRRNEAINKRDRLAKANAAMANIQVERQLSQGPDRVRVTVNVGSKGVGLQLADEAGRLTVRGFRSMDGATNPSVEAGVKTGDIIDQVNGEHVGSFHAGIALLKGLPVDAMATLTLLRAKEL
jgi:interferon-induced GTP-binding protein Mx1